MMLRRTYGPLHRIAGPLRIVNMRPRRHRRMERIQRQQEKRRCKPEFPRFHEGGPSCMLRLASRRRPREHGTWHPGKHTHFVMRLFSRLTQSDFEHRGRG